MKTKILTVFGTRPEVIKLAPFIKAVESDPGFLSITCATTQHRELQNDVLTLFNVTPTYNLDIMEENQDLRYITEAVLKGMTDILVRDKPDFLVVQGDTTTAFVSALAAFYQKIPVVHIEAGLRTGNIFSPFPEEANRKLISQIATLHMAPTQRAQESLMQEGITKNVFMVGNTIVDSVQWGLEHFRLQDPLIKKLIKDERQKVLITIHRREHFGQPLKEICNAIKDLCYLYPSIAFIWPVHPNPNVYVTVHDMLKNIPNLYLLEPLVYADLLLLINECFFIISDSGGIQEESSILKKRIVVLREETERMEIIDAGIGILAGIQKEKIIEECCALMGQADTSLSDDVKNIYGVPGVSKTILEKIKNFH